MKKYLWVVVLILSAFVAYSFTSQTRQQSRSTKPTNLPDYPVTQITGTPYTNPNFGYSLTIPENLVPTKNGANNILIGPKKAVAGPGPANFIYISVYTGVEQPGEVYNFYPENYELLKALEIGEGISLAPPDQAESFTYTRVADVMIANQQVRSFENYKPWEFPVGTTETRMMFENGNQIYILGYYTGGDGVAAEGVLDDQTALSILQSLSLP